MRGMRFVGGMLIGLGLVFVALALLLKKHSRRQEEWTQVPGVVESSIVQLSGESYAAVVTYRYEIRGRRYRCDKVRSLMVSYNWRGPAERLIEKYPPGAAVTVYVNPEGAYDAVLEPGGDDNFVVFAWVFAGMFMMIGAALYFGTSAR